MITHQPSLLHKRVANGTAPLTADITSEKLWHLLESDLDFHGQDTGYASHNFHSFPAKYPPQLPRKFIHALTSPGDDVLDPMMGSGTTLVETYLAERRAIGFDIDPLAIRLAKVKTTSLERLALREIGNKILQCANAAIENEYADLEERLARRWDEKTKAFVDYWFAQETQIGILALLTEIEQLDDEATKTFFEIALSATIITKSGGVSLAFDLGHTRPHRAKLAYSENGAILYGAELLDDPSPRLRFQTKKLRSPLTEFNKRFQKNLAGLAAQHPARIAPVIRHGDAQNLPLPDNAVDLIITSPPYASNAIDYMRAHKFSLVWLGYPIHELGQKRGEYIGGEAINNVHFEDLPCDTECLIAEIDQLDAKKGAVLRRYYSEMTRVLREMYRVLKPGKAAIVVVGSSIMRGRDTETGTCLADIGRHIGFDVPKIGVRNLDRNRRMMPAGMKVDKNSQIQQRMHQEYVIGYMKPATNSSR